MKRVAFCGIFTILLIFESPAQSLNKVLDKHFEAHNQEFWEQIDTWSARAEWHSDLGIYFAEIYAKRPNKVSVVSQKDRFVEAFDGEVSWTQAEWTTNEVVPMFGVRRMMLTQLVTFGSPVDRHPDLVLKGKVNVDGIACYWLERVDGTTTIEYFINARTHLFYKSIHTTEIGGMEDRKELSFSKTITQYRTFNGLSFPTQVSFNSPEFDAEYVFDEIVLGEGIPSSKFERPNE